MRGRALLIMNCVCFFREIGDFLLLILQLKYSFTFTALLRNVYNIYENSLQLVKSIQKSELYQNFPSTMFIYVCQNVFSTCVQQHQKFKSKIIFLHKDKCWPNFPAEFQLGSPFQSSLTLKNVMSCYKYNISAK